MFSSLGSWIWLIASAILLVLEVIVPGVFMLWLGFAALLVGLISLIFEISVVWQGALFAIFSGSAFPVWWKYWRVAHEPTDQPMLNRRADALIGRQLVLESAITGGVGWVHVDDTVWRVAGPDMPEGSSVIVTRTDGVMLHVKAAG